MLVIIGYLAGMGAAALLWSATKARFDVPALQRRNYRDAELVTATGILLPIAALLVGTVTVLGWSVLVQFGDPSAWPSVARGLSQLNAVLVVAFGFALLGLVDDVAGVGESGGFRAHLQAMAGGRLTTGGLKLIGGAWLGVFGAFSTFRSDGPISLVRDGALVALGANAINLFDRAPGRSNKVAHLAVLMVVIAGGAAPELTPAAIVFGAAMALLMPDLREEMMLGDSGSNVLGAMIGLGVVQSLGSIGRWIALVVLVMVNLASERWSFTRIIDSVGPLRRFDRWGSPVR